MDSKIAFTNMLCNGVIMDVMNVEQAQIAEQAGAAAVMALERVPAIIVKEGGIARASDPAMIKMIQGAISIPVMAKCRIGHITEAKILEALEVDCIDESEVLTVADKENHIDKINFNIPFVCGCRNLAEALRRIQEGAALIRCKGQAGTGNILEAVYHLRTVKKEIYSLKGLTYCEIKRKAEEIGVDLSLLEKVCNDQKLPVPFFAAGGIVTPADAALCMELGSESIFVGSGIFLSENPEKRAKAIVEAVNHWNDPKKLAEISTNLGESMK
ncbi:pyridoxal 5'-phosphate synthase lyase subunit PdxS [Rickettsiales endosymbiont of Trichoplax sp. H2]|uniref:pyridoxal 5'-phosphate synthase lyase subunit PdxS n=1 Tax=Rickettsiales endosymbiont of Trichoplax sp. H2 TaxID=2021221 RepID=UPI0012B3F6D0|nr:pyridoxal 5'-phosphate synthase lyase subunit PdxS [Rickettsiales endosymbiont of Trichoplax sp. H2]MSO13902.1 Pyridoxal 5'-phosphate synthase subunit PdxS [Rickettsiales endosymbiont of Trichoplax sp. H2]